MKMLVQRVKNAKVSVEGKTTGEIEQGFLVLLGIAPEDTQEIMEKMVDKLLRLRIFSDENDKINLSLSDVGGSLLLVSQFTLYADSRNHLYVRLLQGHSHHWSGRKFLPWTCTPVWCRCPDAPWRSGTAAPAFPH